MRYTSAAVLAVLVGTGTAMAGDLRLVEAARRHDTSAIRTLLKQGVDVNATQPDGASALHWAAHLDDMEGARALLAAGARVDAVNDYGVTPLSLAAGNGSAQMVSVLLAAGAAPNLARPSGETPLMTAARAGGIAVATQLLDKGATVNQQETDKKQTALMWALFEDHPDMVRLLVERGADVRLASASGMTPLLFAVRQGNLKSVTYLLEHGAELEGANADGVTPLLMAVVRGHVDLIEFLLQKGADVNTNRAGFTPLHWAAGTWETSMTHDYPEAEGEWRALGGLGERKQDVIKWLMARGADINARVKKAPPRFGVHMFHLIKMTGATPFWIAAMSTDAPVLRLLASYGADVKLSNDDGVTPLMAATGIGRVEGDSLLGDAPSIAAATVCLDLGIDINARNNLGETALHGTAWFGLDATARFLVERGADMTIEDKEGQTPQEMAEGTIRTLVFRTHPSTAKVLRELATARGIVASSTQTAK